MCESLLRKDLVLNIQWIDGQHDRFLQMLKKLEDLIAEGAVKKDIWEHIVELGEYAKIHFAEEEKNMGKIGYSEMESHKRAHIFFMDQVFKLMEQYNLGERPAPNVLSIASFMRTWFEKHIVATDKLYVRGFLSSGLDKQGTTN